MKPIGYMKQIHSEMQDAKVLEDSNLKTRRRIDFNKFSEELVYGIIG